MTDPPGPKLNTYIYIPYRRKSLRNEIHDEYNFDELIVSFKGFANH